MNMESSATFDRLSHIMLKSKQLDENLLALLAQPPADCSERAEVAYRICMVTIEQAAALRTLASMGLVTAAACMMRMQCETLTYAAWLAYIDEDHPNAVTHLLARLKAGGETLERGLPSMMEMIEHVGKKAKDTASHELHNELVRLNAISWHTAHSFVYGGLNQRIVNQESDGSAFAIPLIEHSNTLMQITSTILSKLQAHAISTAQ